jgi:hypothetical protein
VLLSWCDRLASTPSVGFQLTPHFALLDIFSAWSPFFDKMFDQFRNPTFTVENVQNAVAITTKDGFHYSADHTRVAVAFVHRLKAKPVSGGLPVLEMLSTPLPYTELLPKVSERLISAARLLPTISERKILQVGVVSTTRAASADLPPGLLKFIEYLGRPWGSKLTMFSIDVISEINSTDNWTDKCLHKLVKPEDPEELMTLTLDFHRQFKTSQQTTEAQMKTLITRCSEDALSYFEDLAVGNRFDEHIIGRKSS